MASLCSAIKLYIKEKLSEIFTARIFISNLEQITKNGCMCFLGQIGLTAETMLRRFLSLHHSWQLATKFIGC